MITDKEKILEYLVELFNNVLSQPLMMLWSHLCLRSQSATLWLNYYKPGWSWENKQENVQW